jgi:hypothetical protein
MLHKIPDSPLRNALLKLVEIQRTLVGKLCELPEGSMVTLDWLKTDVWPPPIDPGWVDNFWENDKGRRKEWMEKIAKADTAKKQEILQLMEEQLDYVTLYSNPPGRRIRKTDIDFWKADSVRKAIKDLLVAFYSPWLNANHGYPAAMLGVAAVVTRAEYLRDAKPTLCPYCDTSLQTTEIDHFLPKSSFPFLSAHPDNFVPSCHDSNEFTLHKGDRPPLDWDEVDQAGGYFHPRLRSAIGRYTLSFRDQGRRLSLSLVAVDAAEQRRVDNLDSMFRLTEDHWGKALETQVQDVVEEVADRIRNGELSADKLEVQRFLRDRSNSYGRFIGKRPLHIFLARLYDFVAHDDELVSNTLRLTSDGM